MYARSVYLSSIMEDRLVAGFMQVIKLCLLGPSVSQESNVIFFKVGVYHLFSCWCMFKCSFDALDAWSLLVFLRNC